MRRYQEFCSLARAVAADTAVGLLTGTITPTGSTRRPTPMSASSTTRYAAWNGWPAVTPPPDRRARHVLPPVEVA